MKPFHFSLEKVLKVRQLETMKAKQALVAAQMAVGQAWVELEQARNERIASATGQERLQKRRVRVSTLAAASEAHQELIRAEEEAAQALNRARAQVVERRDELQEARRKEKALEKLRDQQLELSRQEEERLDQATTDETAQTTRQAAKGDAAL